MAKGGSGQTIIEFVERLVNSLVDIRNIPDGDATVEKKARSLAVSILEENFIKRFRALRGEVEPSDDSYE